MLVTIIVPIYNAARHLSRCLDSILNQTYRNLEIILINDGSTDESKAIIQVYAERDNRIIQINQCNQGVSAARNIGLDKSNGAYVQFVDSDDYIDPNYTEKLIKAFNMSHVGMSICAHSRVTVKNDKEINKEISTLTCGIKSRDDLLLLPHSRYDLSKKCTWHEISVVWNKMFIREVIVREHIRFDENLSQNEDLLFNIVYIANISNINVINDSLYYYHDYKSNDHIGANRKKHNIDISLQNYVYTCLEKIYTKIGASTEAIDTVTALYCSQLLGCFIRACSKRDGNSFCEIYMSYKNLCNMMDMKHFLSYYKPIGGGSKAVPFFIKKRMMICAIIAAKFHNMRNT